MIRAEAICVLSALLIVTPLYSQITKTSLAPVPAGQRSVLAKRLILYTDAFRTKDWPALYDLVSDQNKVGGLDDKVKVSKRTFIRDMHGTYDLRRLIKFTPVRTEVGPLGFDIYGCGEIPYGNEKLHRVSAVRAVRQHGNWFFANWDYADPPEPCSHLSDPAWKPQFPLKLDSPMSQVSCELFTCTL
jgi:hypothetical protein